MFNFKIINFGINLSILFFLIFVMPETGLAKDKNSKIVGLLQVRNEEFFLEQCLRSLSYYTDAIVIVDDASTDRTSEIVKTLQNELNIEKYIINSECMWQKEGEIYNRQLLLDIGRAIGGTHFILLDADEIFSSLCTKENWLRNKILEMHKGQAMSFYMVNLYDGVERYRIDREYDLEKTGWGKKFRVFCDDGICNYYHNKTSAGKIHVQPIPLNRQTTNGIPKDIYVQDLKKAIIHMNTVNIKRTNDKNAWYMCFEFIKMMEKSKPEEYEKIVQKINKYYAWENINEVKLAPILKVWFQYYPFFSAAIYKNHNLSYKKEMLFWFNKYGISYFKDLNIWNLDWSKQLITNSN